MAAPPEPVTPVEEPPKQVGPVAFVDQVIHKVADTLAKSGITTGAELATGVFGSRIVPVKTGLSTRPGPFSIPTLGIKPFAKKVILGTPGGIALEQMAVSDNGDEDNITLGPVALAFKQQTDEFQSKKLITKQTPPMWEADP